MTSVVENRIGELRQLCEEFDVQRMYLFGSATGDRFSDSSDLDFLIRFKDIPVDRYTDNFFNLHERLQVLFGRKVDLLTEPSLKNPLFREGVNSSKELLYAA
jgi:uncharacterized protein